jgi:hypothetical protein
VKPARYADSDRQQQGGRRSVPSQVAVEGNQPALVVSGEGDQIGTGDLPVSQHRGQVNGLIASPSGSADETTSASPNSPWAIQLGDPDPVSAGARTTDRLEPSGEDF